MVVLLAAVLLSKLPEAPFSAGSESALHSLLYTDPNIGVVSVRVDCSVEAGHAGDATVLDTREVHQLYRSGPKKWALTDARESFLPVRLHQLTGCSMCDLVRSNIRERLARLCATAGADEWPACESESEATGVDCIAWAGAADNGDTRCSCKLARHRRVYSNAFLPLPGEPRPPPSPPDPLFVDLPRAASARIRSRVSR